MFHRISPVNSSVPLKMTCQFRCRRVGSRRMPFSCLSQLIRRNRQTTPSGDYGNAGSNAGINRSHRDASLQPGSGGASHVRPAERSTCVSNADSGHSVAFPRIFKRRTSVSSTLSSTRSGTLSRFGNFYRVACRSTARVQSSGPVQRRAELWSGNSAPFWLVPPTLWTNPWCCERTPA